MSDYQKTTAKSGRQSVIWFYRFHSFSPPRPHISETPSAKAKKYKTEFETKHTLHTRKIKLDHPALQHL